MRSERPEIVAGFSRVEVVVVALILLLVILAILPAFRDGDPEERYRPQPRASAAATPPSGAPRESDPPKVILDTPREAH